MNSERKIRVAVVFGGRGPEHAISCASGGTVLACIDRDRYDVVPVGILPDGRWVLTADEPERLAITGGQLPSGLFGANAAWWTLMILALNLNAAMKRPVMGKGWLTKRMKAGDSRFSSGPMDAASSTWLMKGKKPA